jgi:hypothetical protein
MRKARRPSETHQRVQLMWDSIFRSSVKTPRPAATAKMVLDQNLCETEDITGLTEYRLPRLIAFEPFRLRKGVDLFRGLRGVPLTPVYYL